MTPRKIELQKRYKKIFKNLPQATYFSPGRVNLIGEHIDYHGGLVLPVAITIGTYAAVSPRDDDLVRLYSDGYTKKPLSFSLTNLMPDAKTSWANYVRGVFKILIDAGYNLTNGLNIYIESTMPTSGGLSSSSSLELLLIKVLSDMFRLHISKEEMALLGKKVENEYIGVLTGIMDQFVIAHGQKDYALLLNTETLAFDYIPLALEGNTLVVVNTNKRRGLTDSKYNERYNETMAALKLLQKTYNVTCLTALPSRELANIEKKLDPVIFRRVRHIITEQERTLLSAEALKRGNLDAFATYLTASHNSLRDDYEVTGIELDTLVSLLMAGGAIGARMTGAGFGGCAIALVPHEKVANLIPFVTHHYSEKIGYAPTFYETGSADGTHELT